MTYVMTDEETRAKLEPCRCDKKPKGKPFQNLMENPDIDYFTVTCEWCGKLAWGFSCKEAIENWNSKNGRLN